MVRVLVGHVAVSKSLSKERSQPAIPSAYGLSRSPQWSTNRKMQVRRNLLDLNRAINPASGSIRDDGPRLAVLGGSTLAFAVALAKGEERAEARPPTGGLRNNLRGRGSRGDGGKVGGASDVEGRLEGEHQDQTGGDCGIRERRKTHGRTPSFWKSPLRKTRSPTASLRSIEMSEGREASVR